MSEIKERRKRIEREHPGVYAKLVAVDPYGSHAGADWLAKIYLEENLRLEDLPKARDYLKLFRENNNHLKHKSLGHYNSLPELYDAVKPFMPKQEGLEEDTSPTRSDIITVYEQDGLSVRIPTSESAAQYLGRGTQWCTAYTESPSKFWSYALKSPLLHVTTPRVDGKKQRYLLHFEDGQFNDEADKEIDLNALLEKYPKLIPILVPYAKAAIQQNGSALKRVPEPYRTSELCELAVQQKARALKYVPERLRTEAIYELAVKQNGLMLESVPEPLRTEALCKHAVQQNGNALQYVPEPLRTEELYKCAVQQNGSALRYVPEMLRTEALCTLAVQQNGDALQYVPEPLRTEELYKRAVQQNGNALQYVPEPLRTEELYKCAVQQNGSALRYVPEMLRTEALCTLAVQQNEDALQYVPEPLRTEALWKLAVQQDGNALKYLPEHLSPPSLYQIAVQQDGLGLNGVARRLLIKELYKLAVQQDGEALYYVPEHLRTPELCQLAVQQNGEALKYVPEHLRTEALCSAVIDSAMQNAEDDKTARSNIIELIEEIPGELHDKLMKKIDVNFDEAGFIQLKPKELAQGIPDATIRSPVVAGRATDLSGAPPLPG